MPALVIKIRTVCRRVRESGFGAAGQFVGEGYVKRSSLLGSRMLGTSGPNGGGIRPDEAKGRGTSFVDKKDNGRVQGYGGRGKTDFSSAHTGVGLRPEFSEAGISFTCSRGRLRPANGANSKEALDAPQVSQVSALCSDVVRSKLSELDLGFERLGTMRLREGERALQSSKVSELSSDESRSEVFSINLASSLVKARVIPATELHYKEAVASLQSSQVIAVPTDTLYGLACDACSAAGISRIYEIKTRRATSPLAVCVADVVDVARYGVTSHLPEGLLGALLPGPVTLLLPRGESSLLSPSLNPGIPSIGIRIPDSDFIRGVSRAFGGALALTSANISNQLSTVKVEEFEQLWPKCAFVFDAGPLQAGRVGSTVVDLTVEGVFQFVRKGSALEETRGNLLCFGWRET